MKARIGVVTVTYNSAALLDDFLKSMSAQDHDNWHCWIIDNKSTDSTLEVLSRHKLDPSRYTVVANHENTGVAAGNNQGTLLALEYGCDWVLLLNNDTAFPPQLMSHLLGTSLANGWPVVVPKIHFNFPVATVWYGGGGFDAHRGHTSFHTGIRELDAGQYDETRTVDYSPTCCMLIHRSVFDAVGLMDESYFAYLDDTDFCWRLKRQGILIGYTPKHVLIHKVGGSSGGSESPFYARMTARNRLYFLRKHFGVIPALRWLPVFFAYYVFRYLLKSWNPSAFRASVAGILTYHGMRPCEPSIPHFDRR